MEFRLENNKELFGKPDLPTRVLLIVLISTMFSLMLYLVMAVLQKDISLLTCYLIATPFLILIFIYHKWEMPQSSKIVRLDGNTIKYLIRHGEIFQEYDAISIRDVLYIRKVLSGGPRRATRADYFIVDYDKRKRFELNERLVNKDNIALIDYLSNYCGIEVKEEVEWNIFKVIAIIIALAIGLVILSPMILSYFNKL